MRRPVYRSRQPSLWWDARPRRTVLDRLEGLPPLRSDQWPQVLEVLRAVAPRVTRALRPIPPLRDEAPGLAALAAVEAVLTWDPAGGRSLRSWGVTVARWAVCEAVADLRRRRTVQLDAADDGPGGVGVGAEVDARDLADVLLAGQHDLRRIVDLRLAGYTQAETAERLGVSLAVVTNRQHRGRLEIASVQRFRGKTRTRKNLTRVGGFPRRGTLASGRVSR